MIRIRVIRIQFLVTWFYHHLRFGDVGYYYTKVKEKLLFVGLS